MKRTILTLTTAALFSAGMVDAVSAQPYPVERSCRHVQRHRGTAGAVIGGIAGAVLGSNIARGGGRTGGAIIGGAAGAALGNNIGRNSVDCKPGSSYYYNTSSGYYDANGVWHSYDNRYNGYYYSGQNGYYDADGVWRYSSGANGYYSSDGYYDAYGVWHSYNPY